MRDPALAPAPWRSAADPVSFSFVRLGRKRFYLTATPAADTRNSQPAVTDSPGRQCLQRELGSTLDPDRPARSEGAVAVPKWKRWKELPLWPKVWKNLQMASLQVLPSQAEALARRDPEFAMLVLAY